MPDGSCLWFQSAVSHETSTEDIICGLGERSDALPVLDQDERQHHLYDRTVCWLTLYQHRAESSRKFTEHAPEIAGDNLI